jgi:hypothetical protein
MTNLQLNTHGLRKGSTLEALLGADVTAPTETPTTPQTGGEVTPQAPAKPPTPRRRRSQPASASPTPQQPTRPARGAGAGAGDELFWAVGVLEQTSVSVDPSLLAAITTFSTELNLPVATLFAAIVHRGLPVDADAAADVVLLEQADHPGRGREYNLRLPVGLKTRLDELLKGASAQIGRANRADLINAALRASTPHDLDQARELCVSYRRRQTLARRPNGV